MSDIINFPVANPIYFPNKKYFKDDRPSYYEPVDYYHPWQCGDVVRFQFNVNPVIVDVQNIAIGLYDAHNLTASGWTGGIFAQLMAWINGSMVNVTVSYALPTGLDGNYCVVISLPLIGGGSSLFMYSEPINVKALQYDTLLWEYSNSKIRHGFISIDYSKAMIPFYIRVKSVFKPEDYAPGSISTVFTDQPHNNTPLYGQCYDIKKLTVGDQVGIPNFIHRTLNRVIFEMDYLNIDGVNYSRLDNSAWELSEKIEHFDLQVWKIDLVESPNVEAVSFDIPVTDEQGEVDNESQSFSFGDVVNGEITLTVAEAVDSYLMAIVQITPGTGNSFTMIAPVYVASSTEITAIVGEIPLQGSFDYEINLLYSI